MKVNPEVAAMVVQTNEPVTGLISRFENALFSTKRGSRQQLLDVTRESVDFCLAHFKAGLFIDQPDELAIWATQWHECNVMLVNIMATAPTLLIEQGLVASCLEMTRGRDHLLEAAVCMLDERKFTNLSRLFEAGYEPILNHQKLAYLCKTNDVAKCPPELFERFIWSGIAFINSASDQQRAEDYLMALSARYLSCAGSANTNLKNFRNRIWPRVREVLNIGSEDLGVFLQSAIATYPSAKALSLTDAIREDCHESPILLNSLISPYRGRYYYGMDFNPFDAEDVAYDQLAPEFFRHNTYFQAIINNTIEEHLFFDSFPRVVKSDVDFSGLKAYQELVQRSSGSMIELVLNARDISGNAFLITKLTPFEDVHDALVGNEGLVAHFVLQEGWPHLAKACDLTPISPVELYNGLMQTAVDEQLLMREHLISAVASGAIQKSVVKDYDLHMVANAENKNACLRYLGSLSDLEDLNVAREYCLAACTNDRLGVSNADWLMGQVKWKNQAFTDSVFSRDLGL